MIEGDSILLKNTRSQLQKYMLQLPDFPPGLGLVGPGIENMKCPEIFP
jgi:hypothetical protein